MKRHAFGIPNRMAFFCYGDEENARIYAAHLTTANQSKMRRAHLVSVCGNTPRILLILYLAMWSTHI